MVYEYLSGNALNKYPFDDSCNMTASGGYVLPNDVFLDMQFYEKSTDEAYVVSLTSFASSTSSTNITLQFVVRTVSGTLLENPATITFLHSEVADKETILKQTSDYSVKVVPGAGLLAIIAAGLNVSHTFAEANAKLTNSATVQPVPRVRSIKLYNNGTLFKTITEDNITDIAFELEEGTNTEFELLDERVNIDVLPGIGAGLYNPCGDDLVIRSINSVGGDAFGNFLLFTDGCYTSERGYQDGMTFIDNYGLTITNICTPKCTAEQFASFAHYLNRVKDGMDTIGSQAADLANELKDQIADYIADAAINKNKPYVKTSQTTFASPIAGTYYHSVVIGLFNPTEEDINFSISVSSTGTIIADTRRFKSAETDISVGNSYSGVIPCVGVGRFEYSVRGSSSASTSYSGTLDGTAFSGNISL